MNRTAHPFLQLLMLFAVSFGLMGVASMASVLLAFAGVDIQSPSNLLIMQALIQLISFVGPVALLVWLYHRDEVVPFLRLDFSRRAWLLALVGLAAWGLLMPLMDWSGVWNDGWHFPSPFEPVEQMLRNIGEQTQGVMERLLAGAGVGTLVGNLLVIAVVPAVCEELFFRAGMQNLMLRWAKNPHVAIWVTAAVFSLFHGEIFAFVPRLIMGAVLGYLYFGTNSLVPNMVAHFFNNAMVVVLYWLIARGVLDIDPEAPMAAAWPITLGCTVASVAILWMIYGKKLKISH